MGGFGSGREAEHDLVEESQSCSWSISQLIKRHGTFPAYIGSPVVDLCHPTDPRRYPLVCSVPLCWKTAGYGERPFFACPECGRACATLYSSRVSWDEGGPKTEDWACRKCAGLRYASKNRGDIAKARYKAQKTRDAIGAPFFHLRHILVESGWLDSVPDVPGRPRYMRKEKYERLLLEWQIAETIDALTQEQMELRCQLRSHRILSGGKKWEWLYQHNLPRVPELTKAKGVCEQELEEAIEEWRAAMQARRSMK